MAKLVFDKAGEHYFEAGIHKGVLFVGAPKNTIEGIPWNGLTSVAESPDGGDANDQYADNIKYLSLRGTVNYNGTIEAYTYPVEFENCLGNVGASDGMGFFTQQSIKSFSMCYISQYGNDEDGLDYSEKLHIVWNATCSPSEKTYESINDSPEAMSFSFEFDTTPLTVSTQYKTSDGKEFKPTSHFEITKTTANAAKYNALIDALYGTDGDNETSSHLLLPDDVLAIITNA